MERNNPHKVEQQTLVCPNCGNPTVSVGVEKLKVEISPLLVSTTVFLILFTAWKLIVKLQKEDRSDAAIIALAITAVLVVIGILIWFVYNMRQRACHVAHCSNCDYIEALDESPKWTKGWKLKGLPGHNVGGVWVNKPGNLSGGQQPEVDTDAPGPFNPA